MNNDNKKYSDDNQEEYDEENEAQNETIKDEEYELIEERSKKKKKIAIAGGIILFAIIALFFIFRGGSETEEKRQTVNFPEEFIDNKKTNNEFLDIVAPDIRNQFNINEIKKPNIPEITQQLEIKIPEQPKIEQIRPIEQIPKPQEVVSIPMPKVEETQSNKINDALPLILGMKDEVDNVVKKDEPKKPEDDYRARKRYANVLMVGSGEGQLENTEESKKKEFIDLITGRTNKLHTKPSSFAKITDSYVGMKDRMILAGKIIEIVLETRISTAAKEGGMIRAIVSTDVYSESGNNILIPAGSRVIGDYTNSKSKDRKQTRLRVDVGLSRIIRPDGIDILLGGMPITDPLGGKGIAPDVIHSGVGKSIMNSLLIGALSLGSFYAGKYVDDSFVDKKQPIIINNFGTGNDGAITKPKQESTTEEANSTIKDIVDGVTENLKNTLGDGKDIEPVMIINQGKRLSILVDKDIVFTDENAFVFFPGELTSLLKDCCKNY